eukprot:31152-Chlamydomonas_euryale.AAC.6
MSHQSTCVRLGELLAGGWPAFRPNSGGIAGRYAGRCAAHVPRTVPLTFPEPGALHAVLRALRPLDGGRERSLRVLSERPDLQEHRPRRHSEEVPPSRKCCMHARCRAQTPTGAPGASLPRASAARIRVAAHGWRHVHAHGRWSRHAHAKRQRASARPLCSHIKSMPACSRHAHAMRQRALQGRLPPMKALAGIRHGHLAIDDCQSAEASWSCVQGMQSRACKASCC